jgi:hypothetical protein
MKESLKNSSNKGQMSIFLGISLIIALTVLGFVINVGLFVKAKINLQNAVDAAAWSGAAVQARQLTNIAYLNWEIRNTYKEWMFKYYILGQLSLMKTNLSNLDNSDWKRGQPTDVMSFRSNPFFDAGSADYNNQNFDKYNMPSICIHIGSSHNICETYSLPGLPRFDSVGMPGVGEKHEEFLDSIVKTKATDCSSRSTLNYNTALLWAYGTGTKSVPGAPQIAAERTGAWIEALELGLRMRNLEMIVNRPAVSRPICIAGENCTLVADLDSEVQNIPLNERPIKAFWSAYRNLSGGARKENDIFSGTFKLTELPTMSLTTNQNQLSGYLIPAGAHIGQSGALATEKQFLDLQIFPLNLVTFFTSFITDNSQAAGVAAQAACPSSKTALPVPGYIMGFIKNNEVITYYAVKGEAKFLGLFYPFSDSDGITLKAYAAAKPFGGRIGPKLFGFSGSGAVSPRFADQNRSAAYLTGLDTGPLGTAYVSGFPIPVTANFWVKDASDIIGGVPAQTSVDPKFSIPNLLYAFPDGNIAYIGPMARPPEPILKLVPGIDEPSTHSPSESPPLGLYDKGLFRLFASNLSAATSSASSLSAGEVDEAIRNARAPTNYDALNYLIPTMENEDENLNSLSRIAIGPDGKYDLFAPLFGENTLYNNIDDIGSVLDDYLNNTDAAVTTYLKALKEVADKIKSTPITQGAPGAYDAAAAVIHPDGAADAGTYETDLATCGEISMASRFYQFFKGRSARCGIKPLSISVVEHWNEKNSEFPNFGLFYRTSYVKPANLTNSALMTAYVPGSRQGASDDGTFTHPFGATPDIKGKRNYYSTKFIAVEKVYRGGQANYGDKGTYYENQQFGSNPTDVTQGATSFKNTISRDILSEWREIDN